MADSLSSSSSSDETVELQECLDEPAAAIKVEIVDEELPANDPQQASQYLDMAWRW